MRLERNQIIVGDAAEEIGRLPSDSVDCVITSPPYFQLRNYEAAGQLGAEATVDEWVVNLMTVLRGLKRVIKPTGSLWINVADSFSRAHRYGGSPKGLLLGPERLALAMARDGWIIRNKAVWAKSNPMPASVGDRLATAWEPIYFVTRSRHYYFDLDAIRVPHRTRRRPRRTQQAHSKTRPDWAGPLAGSNDGLARLKAAGLAGHPKGKNPGDVWTLATSNYRGSHRATFPERLVRTPIEASCPERVCTACGQPWRRKSSELEPACRCGGSWRPGLVLDPFMGSGTTAVVAQQLGRDWLGIDLNPDFAAEARERIAAARSLEAAA